MADLSGWEQMEATRYQQEKNNQSMITYEHCVKGSWFGGIGNRDLIESEKKCIVGYTEKKIAALLRTGSRYQEAETKKMQQLQELLLKQQQEQNNK